MTQNADLGRAIAKALVDQWWDTKYDDPFDFADEHGLQVIVSDTFPIGDGETVREFVARLLPHIGSLGAE